MIRSIALSVLAFLPASVLPAQGETPDPGASSAPSTTGAPDPALQALDEFIQSQDIDISRSGWKERLPKPPQVTFAPDTRYTWVLKTNKGEIQVRLMPEVAPMHVSSTLYLTRIGFYDGLAFHRVIPRFMAQGGCPRGDGKGSPGYKYDGEFSPDVRHDRPGLLSMANAGPGTDGSQFFLTFVPTPHLDGKHTIFGEVVAGLDVLKALEAAGSDGGQTKEPLKIEKAEISAGPKPGLPHTPDADDPALSAMADFVAGQAIDRADTEWRTKLAMPPKLTFTPGKSYFWNLETNKGLIRIRLMPDVAPMHVSSTIYLSRIGFYDGLRFHRVLSRFMAQGGCPLGSGSGNPGYQFASELSPSVRHDRPGLLSMANTGRPNTDGSQFFLTFVPTPHLDDKHTVFGEVVEGMDTLKVIESLAGSNQDQGRPKSKVEIVRTTISVE